MITSNRSESRSSRSTNRTLSRNKLRATASVAGFVSTPTTDLAPASRQAIACAPSPHPKSKTSRPLIREMMSEKMERFFQGSSFDQSLTPSTKSASAGSREHCISIRSPIRTRTPPGWLPSQSSLVLSRKYVGIPGAQGHPNSRKEIGVVLVDLGSSSNPHHDHRPVHGRWKFDRRFF